MHLGPDETSNFTCDELNCNLSRSRRVKLDSWIKLHCKVAENSCQHLDFCVVLATLDHLMLQSW